MHHDWAQCARGRGEQMQHEPRTHLFLSPKCRGGAFRVSSTLLSVPAWQSKQQLSLVLVGSSNSGAPRALRRGLTLSVLQRLLSYTLPLRAIETYARAQL